MRPKQPSILKGEPAEFSPKYHILILKRRTLICRSERQSCWVIWRFFFEISPPRLTTVAEICPAFPLLIQTKCGAESQAAINASFHAPH
jgi:hypothetical protein